MESASGPLAGTDDSAAQRHRKGDLLRTTQHPVNEMKKTRALVARFRRLAVPVPLGRADLPELVGPRDCERGSARSAAGGLIHVKHPRRCRGCARNLAEKG
jgi:hypothetical protein